jgi:nucleoside-diphosphate-sugar epimerase
VERALVTGGAGYVAASLLPELTRRGVRVRRLFRGEKAPASADTGLVEDFSGDVTAREDIERALEGIDTVFHLASQTSVYVAESDPIADVTANVLPMLHLLEACRRRGDVPTVLFSGTVTVVGVPERLPVDESFPDEPRTVYDFHKLLAERYLEHYVEGGSVRGACLRLANVYGPGPRSSKPDRGVLNAMVKKALAGESLKIYGEGEFVRDYVYVEDVARAFAFAAERPDAVSGRHFLIGTGTGTTVADAVELVARLVERRTGRVVPVEHVPPPPGLSAIERRNFVAVPDAFEQATGFRPAVSLEEGIEATITHFMTEAAAP